jgi:DNA polymerase-3 subunit gamma/tau
VEAVVSYVVLARKWRPRRFEDVVGQEHITGTLSNALAQGRVAHGYLFCGPRGVGKTTTARILAKALNCEKGPTPTPCNECGACLDVDHGRSLDIIEVDGASTRGIDDIRELRDNVRYAPTGGRTKVYIIDEVHMLTREAFNALLKTLEEPPPHVVFVMATTEAFKVPATILSRCQRFDFARIHPKAVMQQLERIAAAEKITVAEEALAVLARRSAGGLRDALSAMDQVLASIEPGTPITEAMVDRVLGILSSDFYFGLTDRLIDGDAAGALGILDEAYHGGADLGEVAEELARHFRNVMLRGVGPELESALEDQSGPERARLGEQAARLSPTQSARLLEIALRLLGSARRSEHLRLHLEMALVEMAEVTRAVPLGEVVRRLEEMERRLGGGGLDDAPPTGPSARAVAPAAAAPPATTRPPARTPDAATPPTAEALSPATAAPTATSPPPVATPPPAAAIDPGALWERVVAVAMDRKKAVGSFLIGSRGVDIDADGRIVVEVDAEHEFSRAHLEESGTRRFLDEVLKELAGRPLGYTTRAAAAGAKRPAKSKRPSAATAAPPMDAETPATPESGAREAEAAAVPAEPADDEPASPDRPQKPPYQIAAEQPIIQKALELFDGEIAP